MCLLLGFNEIWVPGKTGLIVMLAAATFICLYIQFISMYVFRYPFLLFYYSLPHYNDIIFYVTKFYFYFNDYAKYDTIK